MAATITNSGGTTVISGNYKSGTTAVSTSTTIVRASGDTFVSGTDVNRLIVWKASGSSDTSNWQIRRIESVSSDTITIHSPWIGGNPGAGDDWAISTNLADIVTQLPGNITQIGNTYVLTGDWDLQSSAFLGDLDVNLEMNNISTPGWEMALGTIVQFGLLWGGEANGSTEVTNGCGLTFRHVLGGTTSLYSDTNSGATDGFVVNYYGCLINTSTLSPANWMFQRMRGPTRFIGCNFDGPMGGRFYNAASEWVNCQHAGNDNSTPAWSLGATFTRDIDGLRFFQNDTCAKNFQGFGGVFRNTVFTDTNTDIFLVSGATNSTVEFINCTTFSDGDLNDGGAGTLIQAKSITLEVKDSSNTAIDAANVRLSNNTGATVQSESSDINGDVPEILAEFYRWVNSSPSTSFNPFILRVRKYGSIYFELQGDFAVRTEQTVVLSTDPTLVLSEAAADAITGVTILESAPVTFEGEPFSITITGNLTTNPSLTVFDIYQHCKSGFTKSTTFNGRVGMEWHDMITDIGGVFETVRGDYGGTLQGVRIIDENGDAFPGVTTMTADNGNTINFSTLTFN